MRRAARMDVNGWALSASAARTEAPRGAGVIEMNVAEKNMAHVVGLEAGLAKPGHHIVEGGFRTGIEKDEAVIGFKRRSGDDAGAAELVSVDDVDHCRLKKQQTLNAQRPTLNV